MNDVTSCGASPSPIYTSHSRRCQRGASFSLDVAVVNPFSLVHSSLSLSDRRAPQVRRLDRHQLPVGIMVTRDRCLPPCRRRLHTRHLAVAAGLAVLREVIIGIVRAVWRPAEGFYGSVIGFPSESQSPNLLGCKKILKGLHICESLRSYKAVHQRHWQLLSVQNMNIIITILEKIIDISFKIIGISFHT